MPQGSSGSCATSVDVQRGATEALRLRRASIERTEKGKVCTFRQLIVEQVPIDQCDSILSDFLIHLLSSALIDATKEETQESQALTGGDRPLARRSSRHIKRMHSRRLIAAPLLVFCAKE